MVPIGAALASAAAPAAAAAAPSTLSTIVGTASQLGGLAGGIANATKAAPTSFSPSGSFGSGVQPAQMYQAPQQAEQIKLGSGRQVQPQAPQDLLQLLNSFSPNGK